MTTPASIGRQAGHDRTQGRIRWSEAYCSSSEVSYLSPVQVLLTPSTPWNFSTSQQRLPGRQQRRPDIVRYSFLSTVRAGFGVATRRAVCLGRPVIPSNRSGTIMNRIGGSCSYDHDTRSAVLFQRQVVRERTNNTMIVPWRTTRQLPGGPPSILFGSATPPCLTHLLPLRACAGFLLPRPLSHTPRQDVAHTTPPLALFPQPAHPPLTQI